MKSTTSDISDPDNQVIYYEIIDHKNLGIKKYKVLYNNFVKLDTFSKKLT